MCRVFTFIQYIKFVFEFVIKPFLFFLSLSLAQLSIDMKE